MSTTTDRATRIKSRVEEMGIFFEKQGHSPMKGRVLAFLLLAEPPYKDFYEIQEFLQASKSAVSNALNHLQDEGIIDYITFSGDRRRYFRVNCNSWLKSIRGKIDQVTTLKDLLKAVLVERQDSKHLDFNEGLEEIVEFHEFISEKIEILLEEWKNKKGIS
ncbi:MAG: MarR family transcriptional regulator [Phaeodactylibacter sp.]|nr:MarR family transcriptional regulator [Phaeodactylibacter sp.]MCB9303155.1 MarR family transcriptional regulator [Lewinellaceae bacterium]HQU58019.1 MarR family transcriptional regulator [Saprospiraceae bacterium]